MVVDGLIHFAKEVIKRPLVAIILSLFGALGFFNIFFFGFWLGVPSSLRSFLDGNFFASLIGELIIAVAVSSIAARIIVLSLRYFLAKNHVIASLYFNIFNPPYIILSTLEKFSPINISKMIDTPLNLSRFVHGIDRRASFQLRVVARLLRRKKIISSICVSTIIFSYIFLGRHGIWFIALSLLLAPIMWACISTVELRRDFANRNNTKEMSVERVYVALASFVVLYLGVIAFVAGLALYQHRFDVTVSVTTSGESFDISLIAVTGAGVLIGERARESVGKRSPFNFSARFVPYSELFL